MSIRRQTRRLCLALLVFCCCAGALALAPAAGSERLVFTVDDTAIEVFTYRPPACREPALLFVFHGLRRRAESLRDRAIGIARQACLFVFAPRFDSARFPNWRYHRAGVFDAGRIKPATEWTAPLVDALVDQARDHVGQRRAALYLFGHSAGAQLLSRIAAYAPPADVARIVIANPSVYVAPLLDEPVPYGFDGLFSPAGTRAPLRRYLALPITIYLGQRDVGDKHLVKNAAAMRQGANRLQRGRRIFHQARRVAQAHDWPFNWRLVEAPGVGHSSAGMLRAPALVQALGLPPPSATE